MKLFPTLIVLMISMISTLIHATTLEYSVEGVDGELLSNIEVHLGEPPENKAQRSNFIYSAKQTTQKALQAFSYYNAMVETKLDRLQSPWQMTIIVTPNEPLLIKNVDVNVSGEALQEASFQAILQQSPIKVGQPLNQSDYEDLKSSLFNEGLELGYFDSELIDNRIEVDKANNSANVILHYDSGERYHFGDIRFDDIDLEPWILEVLTPFEKGQKYQANKLLQLQNQLQQSHYFSTVAIRPQLDNTTNSNTNNKSSQTDKKISNNEVPIKVTYKPAKRHYFDVGIGYATDTKQRVSFGWRMPKINRYGHSLNTKLIYSPINPTGKFSYNIPLSHPYKDILQIALRLEDDDFGALASKQYEAKVSRIRHVEGWIRTTYLRFMREQWQLTETDFEANYWLPGFTWSRTTKSGSALDPDQGFSQMYTLEGTDPIIGSDIRLVHLSSKFKYVNRFSYQHRFVGKAEFGISQVSTKDSDMLAPSLRFFAGGDQSIRGFAYQSLGPSEQRVDDKGKSFNAVLGGSRIATVSAEYQYYFNDSWRMPLFVDAGQAFDEGNIKPVYSIGTGVHYMSPIGAIRLEVAYGISEDDPPWRIHFTMGAEL